MNYRNLIFVGLALVLIIGISACNSAKQTSITGVESASASSADAPTFPAVEPPLEIARETKNNRRLDALIDPTIARLAPALREGEWINSEPTTLENLRGQVVLVDFWTYRCYNCRNTLPTLKRFDKTYRDKGLTIVGVHTPESGGKRFSPMFKKRSSNTKLNTRS